MQVVAVTRWARPPAEEAGALAPLVGLAAYDLKLKLAGPLPLVLARTEDPEETARLLDSLRARGHGAVSCDLAEVPSAADLLAPRSYTLEADRLTLANPAWPAGRALPYRDLVALILVRSTEVEESTVTTSRKTFSPGRALATGGLMMRKKTKVASRSRTESHERVLYLVDRAGERVRLCEGRLQHQGLGQQIAPTRTQNFTLLIDELRRRAPGARVDDRLATRLRPATTPAHASRTGTGRSNASEIDLAVHLLVIGILSEQL